MEEEFHPGRDFTDIISTMAGLGFAVVEIGYAKCSETCYREIKMRVNAERQAPAKSETDKAPVTIERRQTANGEEIVLIVNDSAEKQPSQEAEG